MIGFCDGSIFEGNIVDGMKEVKGGVAVRSVVSLSLSVVENVSS